METRDNEKFRTRVLVMGLIVVIFTVLNFFALRGIHSDMEYLESSINNSNQTVVSDSYEEELNTIIEKLEAKDALIESFRVIPKDMSGEKLTITYTINITLKEFSKDTKVKVVLDNTEAELKLKDNKFTGKIEVPLNKYTEECVVYVENDGITKTQTMSTYDDYEGEDMIYTLEDLFSGNVNVAEYQCSESEVNVTIDYADCYMEEWEITETNPVLYIKKNDEVYKEIEMKKDDESGKGYYSANINDTFSIKTEKGDVVSVGVKNTGKSGLTYDMLAEKISFSESGVDENIGFDSVDVYDKNGNIIEME